ncbi:hypothetical protein PCAR4_1220001 [Paraburkholderia caribensis]|nr:hypothetical protein PCAR4_1220001 [Paraburkholderia caribensis]
MENCRQPTTPRRRRREGRDAVPRRGISKAAVQGMLRLGGVYPLVYTGHMTGRSLEAIVLGLAFG